MAQPSNELYQMGGLSDLFICKWQITQALRKATLSTLSTLSTTVFVSYRPGFHKQLQKAFITMDWMVKDQFLSVSSWNVFNRSIANSDIGYLPVPMVQWLCHQLMGG